FFAHHQFMYRGRARHPRALYPLSESIKSFIPQKLNPYSYTFNAQQMGCQRMPYNVAQKLIKDHLLSGDMVPGQEIGLKIDQTLTQDATGTLVMLELEAMNLDRAKTEVSAQYIDHNVLQEDHKN